MGQTALPGVEGWGIGWLLYTEVLGRGWSWIGLDGIGRRCAQQVGFVEKIPALHRLFAERWYLDYFNDGLWIGSSTSIFSRNDN